MKDLYKIMLTNVCYSTDLQCESLCIHGRSRTPVPTIKIQFTLVNPNLSYKLTKKINAVALHAVRGFWMSKQIVYKSDFKGSLYTREAFLLCLQIFNSFENRVCCFVVNQTKSNPIGLLGVSKKLCRKFKNKKLHKQGACSSPTSAYATFCGRTDCVAIRPFFIP